MTSSSAWTPTGTAKQITAVKVDHRTVIVGSPSQPMGLSTIVNGVTLRVPRYRFTNGYYEAQEVAIGSRG